MDLCDGQRLHFKWNIGGTRRRHESDCSLTDLDLSDYGRLLAEYSRPRKREAPRLRSDYFHCFH